MTAYKALAKYLKANSSSLGCSYFPIQAPQGTTGLYGTFTIIDTITEVTHGGPSGFGEMLIQFDIFSTSLSDVDETVQKLKNEFVGQSVIADSTLHLVYCISQSELDEFDDEEKIYRRTIDLKFKYNEI